MLSQCFCDSATEQPALAEDMRVTEVYSFIDTLNLNTGMAACVPKAHQVYDVVIRHPCHCGGKFFCSIGVNKLKLPSASLFTGHTQLAVFGYKHRLCE